MPKQYARNPGADQIAKWKQALADYHRQQRQQRGKALGGRGLQYRAGMARITPPGDGQAVDLH